MRRALSPAVIAAAVGITWIAAGRAGATQIVYLDFSDGTETITFAEIDDSTANRSSIGGASPYPAFAWPSISTGVEARSQVVARVARAVHAMFLPYDVIITLTRPTAPPFTTVMIGGDPRDLALRENYGGVAYMDCGNKQPSNIVFAFPSRLRGNERGLVVTIAQEAAHAFGLEHTDSRRDVMHPLLSPEQMSFLDEDGPVLDGRLCGAPTQNSHRRLIDAVGVWQGGEKPFDDGLKDDRTGPRLRVESPTAGAQVTQPLILAVSADDDGGIESVTVELRDAAGRVERLSLSRPPYRFSLGGLMPGPVTLRVNARDRAGNETAISHPLVVGEPAALPGWGCAVAAGGPEHRITKAPCPPGGALVWAALAAAFVRAAKRRRAGARVAVGPGSPCTGARRPL